MPFPLIDTPEVHVQVPLGITTVSPGAAELMAAWTSVEAQVAAVLSEAFATAPLATQTKTQTRNSLKARLQEYQDDKRVRSERCCPRIVAAAKRMPTRARVIWSAPFGVLGSDRRWRLTRVLNSSSHLRF